MANMGYCRFQNTLEDLRDCYKALQHEDWDAETEDEHETRARKKLIDLCGTIANDFAEKED